jgi:pyruvate kinase
VAVSSGSFSEFKGINLGAVMDTVDHLTPQTIEHIQTLKEIEPEWVAFSFMNSAAYAIKAKQLLAPYLTSQWQPKVVAKIETLKGVAGIEEILPEIDIVLVARGDLGLTAPIEKLGLMQKRLVRAAKYARKEVIVSTQILDSLVHNFIPARSDVLDLTNIVLDGADGIMLAKETGISLTPGRSVAMANKIIQAVLLPSQVSLVNFFVPRQLR